MNVSALTDYQLSQIENDELHPFYHQACAEIDIRQGVTTGPLIDDSMYAIEVWEDFLSDYEEIEAELDRETDQWNEEVSYMSEFIDPHDESLGY